jgi:hypothetical protein
MGILVMKNRDAGECASNNVVNLDKTDPSLRAAAIHPERMPVSSRPAVK